MTVRTAVLLPTVGLLATAAIASFSPALAQGWRELGPRERYEALKNYRQYEKLPDKRREDIERKYERWRAMPEPERERMRKNYERYQQLPPEKRQQLRRRKSDAH